MSTGERHRPSGSTAAYVFMALLLWVLPARGEWWDTLTAQKGSFAPLRPFHAHYRFGWTMFPAAEADFDLTRVRGGLTRLAVTAKTIGVVRTSWRMNSEAVATMRTATLRPVSLSQTEIYRTQTVKTHVDYSEAGVSRLRVATPARGSSKTKTFAFPNVYELHSAFHFFRSQRLADGDVYEAVVYPSTDPYLAHIEVQAHRQMKVAGAPRKVIQIELKLWRIKSDEFTLEPHEKFKRATFYLGDDADRMLLRIEGELAVGSVWCELEKVEFAKP